MTTRVIPFPRFRMFVYSKDGSFKMNITCLGKETTTRLALGYFYMGLFSEGQVPRVPISYCINGVDDK